MIMQARIKATGKEILVEPYGDEYAQIFPDGDFKVYTKQELAFSNGGLIKKGGNDDSNND